MRTASSSGDPLGLQLTQTFDEEADELFADPLIGRTLADRYKIVELLGRGGGGSVYEVQATTNERYAAKVVRRQLVEEGSAKLRRFLRESRAVSSIRSPYVVRTFDRGFDGDVGAFIIMELLQGLDLAALLRRERGLDPVIAARLFIQAARGIAAAHGLGIVHRDVKPSNLFLQHDGDRVIVKVCDFGIAKQATHLLTSQEITRTGGILGSPVYMSPEQARSPKSVDARSDVWSLSVALWETLAGRRLWAEHASLADVLVAVCTAPILRLERVLPNVPLELAEVVHRGLVREVQSRWRLDELIDGLLPFTGGTLEVDVEQLRAPASVSGIAFVPPRRHDTDAAARSRHLSGRGHIRRYAVAGMVVAIPVVAALGWPSRGRGVASAVSELEWPAQKVPSPPREGPVSTSSIERSEPLVSDAPLVPAASPSLAAANAAATPSHASTTSHPRSNANSRARSSPPSPGPTAVGVLPARARESEATETGAVAAGTTSPSLIVKPKREW